MNIFLAICAAVTCMAVSSTGSPRWKGMVRARINFRRFKVGAKEHKSTRNLFQTCSRVDPKVDECLDGAIQYAIRRFKNGYSPLLIPSFDPLTVPLLVMPDPSNLLTVLTLINYQVLGIRNIICQNTSFTQSSSSQFRISFDVLVPKADAFGLYTMAAGYLGETPFNVGEFVFNMTEFRYHVALNGYLYRKPLLVGKRYAFITPELSNFYGANLVAVDFRQQSAERNREWLQHPEKFLESYKRGIDVVHTLASALIANLVFVNIPFDQLWS